MPMVIQEIRPSFTSLITDPFASHVLRSLLLLLFPVLIPGDPPHQKLVRSKKSMAWKSRKGTMKSMFGDKKGKEKEPSSNLVPNKFRDAAVQCMHILKKDLDANEVRALAASNVAGPVLKASTTKRFAPSICSRLLVVAPGDRSRVR